MTPDTVLPRTSGAASSDAPGAGAPGLIGTWQLRSARLRTLGGPTIEPFGPDPKGSIIITSNGRFAALLSARGRTPARDVAGKAALLDSFMAYTGRYVVEGDTVVTMVDLCWNEVFSGPAQRQVRHFVLQGDTLTLHTPEQESAVRPGSRVVATLTWAREA